jgi:hypothetical protein
MKTQEKHKIKPETAIEQNHCYTQFKNTCYVQK